MNTINTISPDTKGGKDISGNEASMDKGLELAKRAMCCEEWPIA